MNLHCKAGMYDKKAQNERCMHICMDLCIMCVCMYVVNVIEGKVYPVNLLVIYILLLELKEQRVRIHTYIHVHKLRYCISVLFSIYSSLQYCIFSCVYNYIHTYIHMHINMLVLTLSYSICTYICMHIRACRYHIGKPQSMFGVRAHFDVLQLINII